MPKVHYCVQYSPDWWELRRGIPTASKFDQVMTPVSRKESKGQEPYIDELIADRYCLDPNAMTERPMNPAMRHGVNCEPEARAWYAMHKGEAVQQVGFVTTDCGRLGCSPDGLIGEDGGLELKCPQGKTHVGYLRAGTLPTEYACQVHGSLIVTGRRWWDFMSYCAGFPPLLVRVTPDDFTAALRRHLDAFLDKYAATLKSLGVKDAAAK